MARLFISYNHQDFAYAYAVRHWLIEHQGWTGNDIFVDASHLHTGVEWEKKLFAEAEAAEVMLFLASDTSLDRRSFCYKELQRAKGQILAVTIRGVSFQDERLDEVLPEFAKTRQVTALDAEPAEEFPFLSPVDQTTGSIALNRTRMEGIGLTLRELGVAPNSFSWKPTTAGPFPGLRPLQEGDEAIFCGRELEIRDGLKAIEDLRATVTKRALIIQAPSGAGKSSFLRAGLWRRLRRNPGFTPLCIVRTPNGLYHNPDWGLIAGLSDVFARNPTLAKNLPLSPDALARRATTDLAKLLADFADADAFDGVRRTLLLGIDQAEEITALSPGDDEELTKLLRVISALPANLDIRLILTARDDSVDATIDRLARADGPHKSHVSHVTHEPHARGNIPHDHIQTWRLNRLPAIRFDEIITGPAAAANRAGWTLDISSAIVEALGAAAGAGATGESGDALPILALALQRMVAKRRSPDGKIDLTPGEAATFLESAVTDATHDGLKAGRASADDLRQLVIPRLATWDPKAGAEGAAKRQVTGADELFAGERLRLKPLADALVDQHLLVRSQTESGPAYEVAHEALLRVPPLGKLIFDCREKFEQARILEIEARDWAAKKEAGNLVRSGQRLQDALALLQDQDFGTDLRRKGGVAEYLEACRVYEEDLARTSRRNQRRVMAGLTGLTLVSLAFSALALFALEKSLVARDDARVTEGHSALAKAENAPRRYPDQIFQRARAIGFSGYGGEDHVERTFATFWGEAYRLLRGEKEEFPVLLPRRSAQIQEEIANLPAYLPFWRSETFGDKVSGLAFAENERYLLAKFADGTVRRWDLRKSGEAPKVVKTEIPDSEVTTGAVMEGRMVTYSGYGTISPVQLTSHPADATAWALDTDRKRLVIGMADGSVAAWDVSGQLLGKNANLREIVARGWFTFDELQDLAAGSRKEADLIASLWAEPASMPFAPTSSKPFRNGLGMRMLPVAPGEFLMGSPATEAERDDDETQHRMRLTHPFWLGQYEVTQAEWTALMGENPSTRKDPLAPVTDVSWTDVTAFCQNLTVQERKAGRLPPDWTYTLPTEAQWEFCCRAGTETPFSFGKVLDGTQANCDGSAPYGTTKAGPAAKGTVAVGSFGANPWGFHDLHGNVWEWCRDWFGEYEIQGIVTVDPNGRTSGDYRVFRGGSWISSARNCRSAERFRITPDDELNCLGFRLAAVPSASIIPEASKPETASGR
jgi:formylglycine-generating enzyme